MKTITKELAVAKLAAAKPGTFIPFTWICYRTKITEETEISVVCNGYVRVKLNYAHLKAAKDALESKVAAVMAKSGCSREKALGDIEKTKRETWFVHVDGEPVSLVYHKKDWGHSNPYIQVFAANARDISTYRKTGKAAARKVVTKYIANLGTDKECEITRDDIPAEIYDNMVKKLKKHTSPDIIWIKPLSDVIDIGINK